MDKRTLIKINESLERMEKRGHTGKHYQNLKAKRDAIIAGFDYNIKDVTLEAIGSVGGLIATTQMFTKYKHYPLDKIVRDVEFSVKQHKKRIRSNKQIY